MGKFSSVFLVVTFVGFCSSQLSGKSLFVEGQGALASFVFSESGPDALAIDAGQIWVSPTLGFESNLSEKIHAGRSYFWIFLEYYTQHGWLKQLNKAQSILITPYLDKRQGMGCRCVKD